MVTVEDCVTETQTGFQQRKKKQVIDIGFLTDSLSEVCRVNDLQQTELMIACQAAKSQYSLDLDRGEESLWAHALGRSGNWFMCGPDKASLRCGVILGFREQIVLLESLLENTGHRPKIHLNAAYTNAWLQKTLSELVVAEM